MAGSGSTRVEIVPYDPEWPRAFLSERDRIAAVLGSLAIRIDHNGSTAVPGLAAKPVIDIQVSVEHLHVIDSYRKPLAELGYVHVPDVADSFCPFFHRPTTWPHSHHIHVVEAGGDEERRTLAFRDYLRAHAAVAREYEALKRELAERCDASDAAAREVYAAAKTDFVTDVVRRALAEGYLKDP